MQGGNHCCFSDARNKALIDRRSRCDAQRMAIQTSFAKKVARFQNTYDCFLAPLGNDGELDLALLDVKKPRPPRCPAKKQLGPCNTRLSFSHRLLWREMFSARMRPSYSSSRRSPLPRNRIKSGQSGIKSR